MGDSDHVYYSEENALQVVDLVANDDLVDVGNQPVSWFQSRGPVSRESAILEQNHTMIYCGYRKIFFENVFFLHNYSI